ncbi:MAG: VPLPA-CTERM-specific exosortase XrtD [Pseudomonadota bacterium]
MSVTSDFDQPSWSYNQFLTWGTLWMLLAFVGAGWFFRDGLDALLYAWQKPEYSHGPLIPVLSLLLFLRQLKEVPENPGIVKDRWPGFAVVIVAMIFGGLGKLAHIPDIVAYATILWIGGILLISFGWKVGLAFWPPVLHLVYMLPLPDTFYYKMSTYLQFISSELGVWFLQMMRVPVFLEGNIIDLGVYKLHVADACSGLRYLFPILSFSYIFAVLYRGPMWHKAVLLISAAPITILMNSVRIAIAGYIVNNYGLGWIEGFTHFFEGWVIFLSCIIILFALARIMLFFQSEKMGLVEALDLDTDGLGTQAARVRHIHPSKPLITTAVLAFAAAMVWQAVPERDTSAALDRDSFSLFPRVLGDWRQVGVAQTLEASVARALEADDYHSITLRNPDVRGDVQLFTAWYQDQNKGGIHSPEVCLPGAGWEIAWLERSDISAQLQSETAFNINRAIIQKGQTRMLVYYWFEQKGRKVAWDLAAKFYLMHDAIVSGRSDGAIVRLTTLISPEENEAAAEARLNDVLEELIVPLPRFIPGQ